MFDDDLEFEAIDESVIEQRLKSLGVPFSAEYFAGTQTPPYVVYLTPSADYYGADGVNMKRDQRFRIELYTKSKADKLRLRLFKLFSDVPFSVEEESGGQKNYYYTAITFEQTLDLDID